MKKEEIKIRQSLGEAVPTVIFQAIAKKIANVLKHTPLNTATINKIVNEQGLADVEKLKSFITKYILSLINDYDFEVRTYPGYTTADVFPAGKIDIEAELRRQLLNRRLPNSQINVCLDMFNQGYNLLF